MTCLNDDADEQLRASAASSQLAALLDSHSCSICHGVLCAPVALPCKHVFCSECVRRHLFCHSVCPHPHCDKPATATTLTPYRLLDTALAPIRVAVDTVTSSSSAQAHQRHAMKQKRNGQFDQYLVCLSHRDPGAKPKLIEKLRQIDMPVSGNVRVLAARYREFVLKWNANLDSAVPQSKQAIAELVMKEDRLRECNNFQVGSALSSTSPHGCRPISASFFKKPRVNPPRLQSAIQSDQVDDGDIDDTDKRDDVVAEGDDFDTLIRKTRMRDRKRKRELERMLEHEKCKRATSSPSSPHRREAKIEVAVNLETTRTDARPAKNECLSIVSTGCCININPRIASKPSPSPFGNGNSLMARPTCVNNAHVSDTRRHRVTAGKLSTPFAPFRPYEFERPVRKPPIFGQLSSTIVCPQSLSTGPPEQFKSLGGGTMSHTPTFKPPGVASQRDIVQNHAVDLDQPQTQTQNSSGSFVMTEELRLRIAEKRRNAIERKRKYIERMQIQQQQPRQEQFQSQLLLSSSHENETRDNSQRIDNFFSQATQR